MPREIFIPEPLMQQATTLPPKAYDIKFYAEYPDPYDAFYADPEKINFSFTFKREDKDRSPAYEFLIEILNLETGIKKTFVQLAEEPIYKFWQRQAEVYTKILDEEERPVSIVEEAIVNSKITVVPVNDFGKGESSVFFMPFKDLFFTRSKSNEISRAFLVLNHYWHLFSEKPNERLNRPKIMYIYIGTPHNIIEHDKWLLSQPEWQFTSLTDSRYINDQTYRWSVQDDGYFKLNANGWWQENTVEEKEFIDELVDAMLPIYRNFLTEKQLNMSGPHVFKMAVENPTDNKDTIIVYLMRNSRWQL